MSVCLSVRLSLRLFTFEVPFNRLFAPTSKNLEVWKWSKITKQKKKVFFFTDFALQNKVETTLPDGLETSGQRAYR